MKRSKKRKMVNKPGKKLVHDPGPIGDAMASARAEGRAAFIPFLVAGDPDLQATEVLLDALVAGGADVIELGIPFSDPIADGPVNQRAAHRALEAGTRLNAVLELISRRRHALGVPIVLFSYLNPLMAKGLGRFASQAAASGVDGVLCVDLPPEEGVREVVPTFASEELDPIFLVAPTSTRTRVRRAGEVSRGFVYYVSRAGVTGEQKEVRGELHREVKDLRRDIKRPIAVGFGISTPEQVAQVGQVADGVVVGSALVRLVEDAVASGERRAAVAKKLEKEVASLVAPLRG